MAGLQTMTLQERMNTINGESDIHAYTFQEACNKWLIEIETVNGVDYSGISINKYTPVEVFAIIRDKIGKTDLYAMDLTELINEMAHYELHEYTATEALNRFNDVREP